MTKKNAIFITSLAAVTAGISWLLVKAKKDIGEEIADICEGSQKDDTHPSENLSEGDE